MARLSSLTLWSSDGSGRTLRSRSLRDAPWRYATAPPPPNIHIQRIHLSQSPSSISTLIMLMNGYYIITLVILHNLREFVSQAAMLEKFVLLSKQYMSKFLAQHYHFSSLSLLKVHRKGACGVFFFFVSRKHSVLDSIPAFSPGPVQLASFPGVRLGHSSL